jgi:hypothetical protein
MIDKATLAAFSLAALTLAACPQERPTREACAAACERTAELQHSVYVKSKLLAAAAEDTAALEAKLKEAWTTARAGQVGKQIEDCAIQCEASGTTAQLACVMAAETVGQIRACRKVDDGR